MVTRSNRIRVKEQVSDYSNPIRHRILLGLVLGLIYVASASLASADHCEAATYCSAFDHNGICSAESCLHDASFCLQQSLPQCPPPQIQQCIEDCWNAYVACSTAIYPAGADCFRCLADAAIDLQLPTSCSEVEPSAGCGDAFLDPGEECDDGNLAAGDCCSPTCQFEPQGDPCGGAADSCTSEVCDGTGRCVSRGALAACNKGYSTVRDEPRTLGASESALTFVQVQRDGMNGLTPWGLAVTPDGSHVYAALQSDGIAVHERSPVTGELSFVEVKRNGINGVRGVGGAFDVDVSPDGAHVYSAAAGDDAIAVFSRDPKTGSLAFEQAIEDGVNGIEGLEGAISVAVSPDGAHVYTVASVAGNALVFSRDPKSGAVEFIQSTPAGPLSVAVSPNGAHVYFSGGGVTAFSRDAVSGMLDPVGSGPGVVVSGVDIAVSPDGQHVYVADSFNKAIFTYCRNISSGTITLVGSVVDEISAEGLDGVSAIVVSPDGKWVYSTSLSESAVAVFSRNPNSGMLTFEEVVVDNVNGVDGLHGASSIAMSADGRNVYVGALFDQAIAVFVPEPNLGEALLFCWAAVFALKLRRPGGGSRRVSVTRRCLR